MLFLVSLVLAALFIWLCAKPLKSRPGPFYAAAVLIALAVFGCTVGRASFPAWIQDWVWPLFSRSAFATALFAVVMCTGALPNGSKAIRFLMPIRGELSILACILTLGHNAAYGMTYFRMLFTRPERLPAYQLAAAVCSLVMICIMLPLFVTSFRSVRRKMKGSSWKRLQRLAYGFYGLLYIHVMLLTVPQAMTGRGGYALNMLVYSVVFLGYGICRVLKAVEQKARRTEKLPRRQAAALAGALALSLCLTGALEVSHAAGPASPDAAAAPNQLSAPETPDTQEIPEDGPETEPDLPGPAPLSEQPEDRQEELSPAPEEAGEPEEIPDQIEPEDQEVGEQDTPAQEEEAVPASEPSSAPEPPSAPETGPAPEAGPTPEPMPEPSPEPVRVYQNGVFSGTGEGYWDAITVSVTIQDDVITDISIAYADDDEPYFSNAKAVIGRVLTAQNTNVDTVSGATYSSGGILDAIDAALAAAKN